MLNKRIKSLLVAGLLVFSMNGVAFATEDSVADKNGVATITNPKFDANGNRSITKAILNGDIKVNLVETVDEDGDYLYNIEVSWDSTKVKLTDIQSSYENGNIMHGNYVGDWYHCNTLVKEGDIYKVTVEGGSESFETIKGLGKLTELRIYYEAVKSSDPVNPNPNPDPEEKITYEPVTGDASIMPIVITAVVSAAGLYVLNKKDDEE